MAAREVVPPGMMGELSASSEAPAPYAGGFSYFSQDSEYLPPLEFRLPEFREGVRERIPTPVDSNGMVIVPELIKLVKGTIYPEYVWPKGKKHEDTHHLFYVAENYAYQFQGGVNPTLFRELSINKIELPRIMHGWLHMVMEEPQRPSDEVMQHTTEAVIVAKRFFASTREAIQWERRGSRRADYITENPEVIQRRKPRSRKEHEPAGDYIFLEYLADLLNRQFSGIESHITSLAQIPPEFRIVEPKDSPTELASEIGRYVVNKSLKVGRFIHQVDNELAAA